MLYRFDGKSDWNRRKFATAPRPGSKTAQAFIFALKLFAPALCAQNTLCLIFPLSSIINFVIAGGYDDTIPWLMSSKNSWFCPLSVSYCSTFSISSSYSNKSAWIPSRGDMATNQWTNIRWSGMINIYNYSHTDNSFINCPPSYPRSALKLANTLSSGVNMTM